MTTRHQGAVPSDAALRRCVDDPAAFLDSAWGRRTALRRRAGDDVYADLLSLADVERILTGTSPRRPAVRVVRDGRELSSSTWTRRGTLGSKMLTDLPDVARLLGLFDEGATIVLQGLHRSWPPVAAFCRQLELVLTHPVQANAYLTPPGSQGLRVHHDTHDVLALQTHGRKRWVTYPPAVASPLPGQRWTGDPAEVAAIGPELDVELTPGDCLYVPRGVRHAAATVGDASLHLTIGIRTVTWHDVLGRVVDDVTRDVPFRDALPAGFARRPDALAEQLAGRLKQLADAITDVDATAVADAEQDRLWAGLLPHLDGQLTALLALDAITDDTVVAPRAALPFTITPEPADRMRLRLRCGGAELTMPAFAESAVVALLSGPVRVGDLPGTLDAAGRQVLVRRLVREGLVRPAPSSSAG